MIALLSAMMRLVARGFSHPAQHVCHLHCAIYGLKQIFHTWFEHFHSVILSLGFTESSHDYVLFTRQTPRGLTILLLYVNDMVISSDDANTIISLKCQLHTEFQMNDLDPLHYFQGLEITYSRRSYLLSQQKYISVIF